MQVALVDTGRQVAPRTATQTASATRAAAPAHADSPHSPVAQAVSGQRAAPVRGGLKGLDTHINTQVAATQQALEFLDRAGAQLQDLKTELTGRLASRMASRLAAFAIEGADDAANDVIERQVRRFDALWRERSAASGGTLDNRLDYNTAGQALQRFSVRGLQMNSLQAGEPETLSFSVGGKAQRSVAVAVEPGLSDVELAQRFDRALAPNGIRASLDAQGDLNFSVAESAWPALRDSLAIKGEGRRFSTGQFSQLRLVPDEPAIRPQEWSVKDTDAMRRTRQQVMDAQEIVRNARHGVSRALTELGTRLNPRTVEGKEKAEAAARWSAEFAQTFEATAGRADYQSLSAMTPALLGISRERVTALLSVPAG